MSTGVAKTGWAGPRLWRDVARLLVTFWRSHPWASLGLVLLTVAGGLTGGLYTAVLQGFVDALVARAAGEAEALEALRWVGILVATAMVEVGSDSLRPAVQAYLQDHGFYRLQRQVLERAAAVPLLRFEESAFYDHLRRASNGLGQRLVQVFTQLVDLLRHLAWVVAVAVSLATLHTGLAALVLVGTLPGLWLQSRVATLLYQVSHAHTAGSRLRAYLQGLLTARESAAELRLFGVSPYLLARWGTLWEARQRDEVAASARRSAHEALANGISALAYAAALVGVAVLIGRGRLSLGTYAAFAQGALWLQMGVGWVFRSLAWVGENAQFLGDLFTFLQVAQPEAERTDWVGGPRLARRSVPFGPSEAALSPRSQGLAVTARGITFTYPGAPSLALADIDLDIRPGEKVAIVGQNGAGKSTLAKLLIGLYHPDQGVVLVNGQELAGPWREEVRRRTAAIFQDFPTYQLTLRENVGLGRVEAQADTLRLETALRQAGLDHLPRTLPQSWETYLGRQFGDTDLSGGQWQRLALARAFFRQADLLVLDEPTSALDPLAELALYERFAQLASGRTAIMISHRLGMARLADRVVVLVGGRIVETGTHDELLALGGEYAQMFAAQARWYQPSRKL